MSERIEIFIDDEPRQVEQDATVAAALLDAGVTAFRTSVGGEPRAPLCGMGICYECRVTIDGAPQQRSCMMRVAPGMRVLTAPGHIAPRSRSPASSTDRADVVIVGGGPAGLAAAADLVKAGFSAAPMIETIAHRSRADSPEVPAIAYCQGTPLLNEIEERDASRVAEATDVAARAIAARFGTGKVDGKISAHIVSVTK